MLTLNAHRVHIQPMTLEQWMAAKKLKDADVARLLEDTVSRSQISRIRRGDCFPTQKTARALETLAKAPLTFPTIKSASQSAAA